MRTFSFDGIDSSQYFIVNRISRPLMAPIKLNMQDIPRKHGAYIVNSEFDALEFSIEVTAKSNNYFERRDTMRVIAEWLQQNEDKRLIFSDEPNIFYMARLQGSTDLDELRFDGAVTLNFICAEPFGFNQEEKSIVITNTGTATNNGTMPVYPQIRVVPSYAADYIKIIKGNKNITLNRPVSAWSRVMFDLDKNEVFNEDDGISYMADVTIESDFFALEKGANDITLEPIDAGDITARVIFRERYK